MEWLGPALSLIGVVSAVVAAVYVGRSRAKDETIKAQQSTIETLAAGQNELRLQMDERERHCSEQIAQLRGRVDALAEQQSEVVATLLAPRIVDGLVAASRDGRWGFP